MFSNYLLLMKLTKNIEEIRMPGLAKESKSSTDVRNLHTVTCQRSAPWLPERSDRDSHQCLSEKLNSP